MGPGRSPWAWYLSATSGGWGPLTVAAGGWLICAVLAWIALSRLFAYDRSIVTVWVNAYTFWVFLPAYACAVAGLVFRRWGLLALALVLVACHLWWVRPAYVAAAPIPAEAWSAPRLRLATTNLKFDNDDFAPLMAEVARADPDVVFFQEFTEEAKAAAEAARLLERLPFTIGTAEAGTGGTAIYSRYPLIEPEVWMVEGIPMARATVELEGRRVVLFNVHPVSPTKPKNVELWNEELAALERAFDETAGNMIAAGDFNLTQHHRWYRELTDGPLRDANVELGNGNATTWPNGQMLLPEIRIDQVFVGGALVPLAIRQGEGEGSDHRPTFVEIALLR